MPASSSLSVVSRDFRTAITASHGDSIQPLLDQVAAGGVVEITDSSTYAQPLAIRVNADAAVELRAADESRPVLFLDGELLITGGDRAEGRSMRGLFHRRPVFLLKRGKGGVVAG